MIVELENKVRSWQRVEMLSDDEPKMLLPEPAEDADSGQGTIREE